MEVGIMGLAASGKSSLFSLLTGQEPATGGGRRDVSLVGIAGSAQIGNGVTLAAQSGVAGHIKIGDNCVVAARAGVTKSIPPNSRVSGWPAVPHDKEQKVKASVRRLPDLQKRLRSLEKRLASMETRFNGKTEDD